MQNLERNQLVVSKLTWGMRRILTRAPKFIMFELKKYIRVMFDSTEDWCKIWRKTDVNFQKWHKEFLQAEKNWFYFRE